MKKFLGFIETSPVILFHYIPLIGVLYLWYYFAEVIGIMNIQNILTQALAIIGTLYLFLLVGDNLIHKIIGKY